MRRHRHLATGAVTAAAVTGLLLAAPAAGAVDVWGNVGPASQLPAGALADAYPLGNYALDHHFSAVEAGVFSGVDVSGIAPTVAWMLANFIWLLTALLANAVITLFTFAFSLDLVNGSETTGGAGALAPVSEAVRSIYRDVFGQAWLTVAVLLAGMWSMWNALVRRRYTETAGALALSLLYVVIALAFVTQPERTIGTASRWTNEISVAFLTLTTDGSVGQAQRSKQDASDHLFGLLVYQPWVVLQFGGLEHCVRDGSDVRVRPLSRDAGRDAQLARRLATSQQVEADDGKVCLNNRIKYAPHFLRFEPGSEERNAEYEALKDGDSGKLPNEDPGKDDGTYRLSDIDKPAAEAMQKSGQYQRLGLAVVIFAGELGAFLLLGSLAVAVILAQVLVLLLLAFAPVALVIGTFPGRGHQFFLDWLTRVATFLLKKAFYALILAVLLAVSAALQDATANLGWLMAWGLQAVFYWAVFLNRKQLAGQLGSTVTGTSGQRDEARLLAGVGVAYAMSRVVRRTFGGIAKAAGGGTSAGGQRRAPPATEPPTTGPPAPTPPSRPPLADDGEPSSSGSSATSPAEAGGAQPAAGAAAGDEPARSPRPRPAGASTAQQESSAGADPGEESATRPASPDATEAPPPAAPESVSAREAEGRGATDHSRLDAPQAPARTSEPPTSTEHERPGAPADRPARAAEPANDNPLLSSLRTDAQRLHRDAQRLHDDARHLGDERTPRPPDPNTNASDPRARRARRPEDRGDRP